MLDIMDSITTLTQKLSKLQQEEAELWLSYTHKSEQINVTRNAILSEMMSFCSNITDCTSNKLVMSHINDQNHKATVNGSRNTNGLHTHTTEDSYSVILDLTNSTLKYREDPENHSPLIKACSQGLGPHRIQLLAYMLEHPGDPHFADNIYKAYTTTPESRSQNNFTKAISLFRKALEQKDTTGPYIKIQFDTEGITGRKRGYIYRVNPEWHYLVIRTENKISETIPLQIPAKSKVGSKLVLANKKTITEL